MKRNTILPAFMVSSFFFMACDPDSADTATDIGDDTQPEERVFILDNELTNFFGIEFQTRGQPTGKLVVILEEPYEGIRVQIPAEIDPAFAPSQRQQADALLSIESAEMWINDPLPPACSTIEMHPDANYYTATQGGGALSLTEDGEGLINVRQLELVDMESGDIAQLRQLLSFSFGFIPCELGDLAN